MSMDADIEFTLHDIATAGFKVVRTWAFNDVPSKPVSGTYFQVCRLVSWLRLNDQRLTHMIDAERRPSDGK